MVKWQVRMTELLKEKELNNFSTFINLHIIASLSVNIYCESYWSNRGIFFKIFLYIFILLGYRLWRFGDLAQAQINGILPAPSFPTADMINTYCASWWMLFIICGGDKILVFICSIKLMCGDKTLHLVCRLGSVGQPIALSCWMNGQRCAEMETSGSASSAGVGLFS